ncbi:MAG: hypothetical protein ACLU80_16305 [Dorea sp.]
MDGRRSGIRKAQAQETKADAWMPKEQDYQAKKNEPDSCKTTAYEMQKQKAGSRQKRSWMQVNTKLMELRWQVCRVRAETVSCREKAELEAQGSGQLKKRRGRNCGESEAQLADAGKEYEDGKEDLSEAEIAKGEKKALLMPVCRLGSDSRIQNGMYVK